MSVTAPPKVCEKCGAGVKSAFHLAACRHKYTGPSGFVWPSVTAITGIYDDGGKSGGMAAVAARLTREGFNYRDVWSEKAKLGTRVHGYVEAWINGESVECPESDKGYLDAAETFFLDHSPRWLHTERIVSWESSDGTYGYGGRFDAIAVLDQFDRTKAERWLIDVKTGKRYAFEHSTQLAAYRYADGMVAFEPDGSLTPGLEPLPVVDKAGCLYLSDDGTYELVEYPADERAFDCFLHLLRVHRMHAEIEQRAKGEPK